MSTPNLALETVPTGVLQPGVPLNDSLQALDALVRPGGIVQDKDIAATPTTVAGDAGKMWIVATGATGAWASHDGELALCTGANLWRYFTPSEGWRVRVLDEDADYEHSGSAWTPVPPSRLAPVNALTNSAGTVTVNCALGRDFTITLAANVTTLTMSNLAGVGYATEVEIEIKQDATGGRTFALPASFKALGGSDTAIASAANAVTILSAKTFDNGTTWRYAMQESE